MDRRLNDLKQKKAPKPKPNNVFVIAHNLVDNHVDDNIVDVTDDVVMMKDNAPRMKMMDLRNDVQINRNLILERLKKQNVHHILVENKIEAVVVEKEPNQPIFNPVVELLQETKQEKQPEIIEPVAIQEEKTKKIVIIRKPKGKPKAVNDAPVLEEQPEPEPQQPTLPVKKRKTKKNKHLDLEEIVTNEMDENAIHTTKFNGKTLNERLPQSFNLNNNNNKIALKVSKHYMNNRKLFVDKMKELFRPHKKNIAENNGNVSCSSRRESNELFTHQKIVKEYLSLVTPYRGLLLYHGLGSGKTCGSIAIAEGMKSHKQIVLMTPASLKMNFFSELKKCGDDMFKKNQHWDFITTEDRPPEQINTLAKVLQISPTYIRSNGGVWLVDTNIKTSNYATLTAEQQTNLDEQLNMMIRSKYIDINYNSSRIEQVVKELTQDYTVNPFDHKTIIIDEAHNFVSRIVNKLKNRKSTSRVLYDLLMDAVDVKIVLLTGTPVINYPNELGVLFNILRGYIKTWTFELNVKPTAPAGFKVNEEEIVKMFNNNDFQLYDYVHYSGDKLTVTRNPFGFINATKRTRKVAPPPPPPKGGSNATKKHTVKTKKSRKTQKQNATKTENGEREQESGLEDIDINYYNRIETNPYQNGGGEEQYDGVKLDETGNVTDEEFVKQLKSILSRNHIEIATTKLTKNKALPDDKDAFIEYFMNTENHEIKNANTFKKRILGLTSYFRSADEQLLPEFVKTEDGQNYHLVLNEMSDYQFAFYEKIRKDEADKEKNVRKRALMKKNDELFNISSTYRVFSREACNFAFPDPPGKPMIQSIQDVGVVGDNNDDEPVNDYELMDREEENDEDIADGKAGVKNKRKHALNQQVQRVMDAIKHDPTKPIEEQYLILENLGKYSQKFKSILENIMNPENVGLHLLYSQFRSMEGIGVLKLALEANGFSEFKIVKNASTDAWTIDNADEIMTDGKPKFVLYTGTETAEEKEIIRNIYNSQWDMVPATISSVLRQHSPNNFMGQVIKMLMITASGSEGINLRNTRFVHIVEPYWNMVRIEQVIGRARRICSHEDLPKELRTVKVFLYLSVFSAEQKTNKRNIELMVRDTSRMNNNKPITTDENLYEISVIKTKINEQLLKAVKETSMDCSVYYSKKNDENIACYNFGKITSNNFATMPTLEEDIATGETDDINVRKQKLKLKKITVNGVNYAFDAETNIIYSYDSFLQVKEGNGTLERVGKVVKEGTKYKIVIE